MAPEPSHQSPQTTFSPHTLAVASQIRQAGRDGSRGGRGNRDVEATFQYSQGPNGVPSPSPSPSPPPSQSPNTSPLNRTVQTGGTTDAFNNSDEPRTILGSNGNKYSTGTLDTTRQSQAPTAPTAAGLTTMVAPYSFGIPELYPPELFATIHDQGIYRCTSIDYSSLEFLKTLNLKTILTLTVEKPRSPLRRLCSSLNIQLIHSALWTGASPGTTLSSSTTTTTQPIWEEPAWKQAVDEALSYLAPEYRPVLVVDGVGVFCGVVRRGVMGWGVTASILEYRSFFWGGGGQGGRYGCEEVVEMVDVDGGWGGKGVNDLRVGWACKMDREELERMNGGKEEDRNHYEETLSSNATGEFEN